MNTVVLIFIHTSQTLSHPRARVIDYHYRARRAQWKKAGEFSERGTKKDRQWEEKDGDEHFYFHGDSFLSDGASICCDSFVSFYVFSEILHSTSSMCDAHTVNSLRGLLWQSRFKDASFVREIRRRGFHFFRSVLIWLIRLKSIG